jgi:fructose 5-dehydrogenase cytochrome subunit
MRLSFRWRAVSGLLIFIALSLGSCSVEEVTAPLSIRGEQYISRGREIVTGLGACGSCHSVSGLPGEPLSGGRRVSDLYGDVQSPNITLGEGGLKGWSERDVLTLIRSGKRPDGTFVSPEIHRGYEWMADIDVAAVIGYLRTLPPINKEVERREIGVLQRNTTGFFTENIEVVGYVPAIPENYTAERGQYLADHVARCQSCHNSPEGLVAKAEYWAGGKMIRFGDNEKIAPNITTSKVSGIGEWTEADLKNFFRSGRAKDGRTIDSKFCPVNFYRFAPEEEVSALVAYIRTVPDVD